MSQCYLDDSRLQKALGFFDEMDVITEAALFIMRIYYIIMYLALSNRFVCYHINFTFIRF